MDDLKIVDTHQHFWDLERNYYPWLCDEPPAPHRYGDPRPMRRTYLPPDYFADAAGYNVVKMVHVEAEWDPGDPLGETRWLQEIAAAHGVPHALVAQAWLDRDDTEQMLAAQAAFANVRGVRHKPATALSPDAVEPGAPGSMGDARWRAGYALLESFGLSFDLQTNYWHLYEAADLAEAFPATQMILNSTGYPLDRSEQGLAGWRAGMKALAGAPNVAVKIAGIGLTGGGWSVEANRPLVLETIEMFGIDRCMVGSNFPPDSLAADFATIFGGLMTIVGGFPRGDQEKLFHDNAVRIYRLDPA